MKKKKKEKLREVKPKPVKVPFKKKPTLISKCPSWYLKWVAENWREDTPANKAICWAADKEYQYRLENGLHNDTTSNEYMDNFTWREY